MPDETAAAPEPLDLDSDVPPPMAAVMVASGGAVGTALRYGVSQSVADVGGVPVGILVVNLTGAALLGVLVAAVAHRAEDPIRRDELRLLLGTGLIGGYTTYSALATGAAELIADERVVAGVGYALTTVVLGAVATWLGMLAGRAIGSRR